MERVAGPTPARGWLALTMHVRLTGSASRLLTSPPRLLTSPPRRPGSAPRLALARPLLGPWRARCRRLGHGTRGTATGTPVAGVRLAWPLQADASLRNRRASGSTPATGTHVAHRVCSAPSRILGTLATRWPTILPERRVCGPYWSMGNTLRIDPEPNAVFAPILPKSRAVGTPVASCVRALRIQEPRRLDGDLRRRLPGSAKRFLQNDGRIVAWMRLCGTIYVLER
jgi:hypothetical protein